MATVEVLNPPPMYRIRPYFTIKKVKLPDCMYLLKPVHQLPNLAPSPEVLFYLKRVFFNGPGRHVINLLLNRLLALV